MYSHFGHMNDHEKPKKKKEKEEKETVMN